MTPAPRSQHAIQPSWMNVSSQLGSAERGSQDVIECDVHADADLGDVGAGADDQDELVRGRTCRVGASDPAACSVLSRAASPVLSAARSWAVISARISTCR